MLTQTVTITQNSNPNIIIGRRSTYETQQVIFDVSWLIQTYGEGTAELLIKRPKDASAYPVVATLDGNTLTWTVSETDTQDKGHGECEIYWYVDGGLAKSCICGITILRDIGETTETAPDPYETWVDELARLGAETLTNAQAAEQSANDAAQSASEADNSAAAALESEENALNSENAAKASEQAAAASKQGAEQSATEAAQSANAAESSAANAQESAGNSSASADRAEQAAASIEGDTERAEAAARTAQDAASDASGFAGTASTKATEAAGSAATAEQAATTATQKAADASAAATAAAGSASSASASATAAGNAQSAAETAQSAAETAAQSIEDSAAQIDTNTADILNLKSAIEDLQALTNRKAGMLVDTASGSVASFVPDATVPNLLGVSVDIEPVQDLHGYDSPWPAGGGSNLLPEATSETVEVVGVTVTISADGSITINGTATTVGYIRVPLPHPLPVGEYTWAWFNNSVPTQKPEISLRNEALNPAGGWNIANTVNRTFSFTSDAVAYYWQIQIPRTTYDNFTCHPMLVAGGTAPTAWSPFENICPISGWDSVNIWNKPTHDTTADPTVTIQLGQTVYGGTLDAVNGTMTVDRAMVAFDGTESAQNQYFPTVVVNKVVQPGSGNGYDFLNSHLPSQNSSCNYANASKNSFQFSQVDTVWGASSADELLAIFREQYEDGTPVQICYPLATPITITLDPVTISTIANQTNNVWANTGDVTVEYAADLKTYIDNKIAAAVAALS